MTIIFWILLALLVFFVVVMIHEWGHFITARLTGMRVLEFGMGIPPKIKKIFTDKKGTEFTLNALPLGGFVRIDGEDITKPTAFDDGNFMSKNWAQRMLVLVAGVTMNFFLAWVIFSGLFFAGVKPLSPLPFDIGQTHSYFLPSFDEALESGFITSSGVVLYPLEDGVAARAGIESGDILLSLNGESISHAEDAIAKISANLPLQAEVLRKQEKISLEIVPENGKIQSYISDAYARNENFSISPTLGESLVLWAKETYFSSILTVKLVGRTLGNFFFPPSQEAHEEAKKSLSGPVGAGNAMVMMLENSVPASMILLFTALLSVNLAVMNLLPFPALDGGRMVFTTIYSFLATLGVSKMKILKVESVVHSIGFLLLILFMFYVAGLDISRFFN